ncbi:MAG: endonuclease MutS2 [Lachnospiraceae bacterium]|nr:endonuclease MutS2 [Lachnospiraceae bacterium]
MNKKALKTLEYNKIVDLLVTYAQSEPGKELCRNLLPSDNLEEIRTLQTQTSDALSRLLRKGSVSFSGTKDIRASLKRLDMGGSLNIVELLTIAGLLRTVARVKTFGVRDIPEEEYDSLDAQFNALVPLAGLCREIDRCIISEEEIADDASSGLREVRRQMASVKNRIQTEMNSCLQSYKSYLQDAIVTMRNGRYCLPVKSEHRSQVNGMIHDQSATGSTVFIEPAAIIKLNNDLRQLEISEQKEIEKVLATLSNSCATEAQFLDTDYRVLVELDFIFARAALSRHYNGSEPVFNTDGYINIKKGRHPLISKDKVVPIDIYLGDKFDLLIITGPNTGGKTVSLKTIGLFTLMGQAGLHIPAFDNSSLAVFKEVYADIGDEQSIEQSLSTFSSHMTNIAPILKTADKDSLVLFDELGAGTDPTEGAALATSILAFLHNMKVRTVATTHYAELKLYALSTPGVENACCEFDVETLRPTYRLLIGIPGKSNAFAISGKLGIPDYIIDDAKKRINSEDTQFEDIISDLESGRVQMEKEKAELEKLRREAESQKAAFELREQKFLEKQDKIISDANDKANALLSETKAFVDETIRLVNKQTAGSDLAKALERERTKLRDRMKDTADKKPEPVAPKKPAADPKKIKVGCTVMVNSMNLKGTVLSLPNAKNMVSVQMGILTTQAHVSDLTILSEGTTTLEGQSVNSSNRGKLGMSKTLSISSEINLIGKTVDEALPLLDKYLDDAYLAHMPSVRVVHGKGSGILKNAVHRHLKGLKYVASYRLGEFGEGDAGVTIVTFK